MTDKMTMPHRPPVSLTHVTVAIAAVLLGGCDSATDEAGSRPAAQAGATRIVVSEKVLARAEQVAGAKALFVNFDSTRVAAFVQRKNKWVAVVNGMEGQEYDGIGRDKYLDAPRRWEPVPLHHEDPWWKELARTGLVFEDLTGFVFSPDGTRVAYRARKGKKWVVVLDGKEGKEYESISRPMFCPKSKRLAYFAFDGRSRSAVVDGREGKKFPPVRWDGPFFSPDGRRLAYEASLTWDHRQVVVVDGEVGKAYDYVHAICFSPDGKHVAYAGHRNRSNDKSKLMAVIDGKEGKEYERISDPVFSLDGKRVVHAANKGNKKWVAVVDGKEGREYDSAYPIVFSPDGRTVAYRAQKAKKHVIVVNGRETRPYDRILAGPIFSPDGRHLAYGVVKDRKRFDPNKPKDASWYFRSGTYVAVVDGQESDPVAFNHWMDHDMYFRFSPGGTRLMFWALSLQTGRWTAAVDDNKTKMYRGISSNVVFSPRGERVAFVVSLFSKGHGGGMATVIDGKEGKHYDYVGEPVFSPDGKHVAYKARHGKKWFVVVDGQEGRAYDDVGAGESLVFGCGYGYFAFLPRKGEKWAVVVHLPQHKEPKINERFTDGVPVFSPDGEHLAYPARRDGKWFLVLDGREFGPFDSILPGARAVFDGPDRLHFLASKGGRLLLVDLRGMQKRPERPRQESPGRSPGMKTRVGE